jgi:hypothetical protein
MTIPKHPEIVVKLVGGDGNALAILGTVRPGCPTTRSHGSATRLRAATTTTCCGRA